MSAVLQQNNKNTKASFDGVFVRTISITIGAGSNQVLVAKWIGNEFENFGTAAWAWNGTAMTIAGTAPGGADCKVQIAYLKAPAQGTFNLTLTTADQHNLGQIEWEVWSDVDQATAFAWTADKSTAGGSSWVSGASVPAGYTATYGIGLYNAGSSTSSPVGTDTFANLASYTGDVATFGYSQGAVPGHNLSWGSANHWWTAGTLVMKDAIVSSAQLGVTLDDAVWAGAGQPFSGGSFGITLDDEVWAGAAVVSPVAQLGVTLDSLIFSGAGDPGTPLVAGSISTPPLHNSNGGLLASRTGVSVNVYHPTTGALIIKLTGLTTNSLGVATFSSTLMPPGTTVAYEVVTASEGRRLPTGTAA